MTLIKNTRFQLQLDLGYKIGKTMAHEHGHAVCGEMHFRDHYLRLATPLAVAVPFDKFDEMNAPVSRTGVNHVG